MALNKDVITNILECLRKNPKGLIINDLVSCVGKSRGTLPRYLSWLEAKGVVNRRKIGSAKMYTLTSEPSVGDIVETSEKQEEGATKTPSELEELKRIKQRIHQLKEEIKQKEDELALFKFKVLQPFEDDIVKPLKTERKPGEILKCRDYPSEWLEKWEKEAKIRIIRRSL